MDKEKEIREEIEKLKQMIKIQEQKEKLDRLLEKYLEK